ncbi:MAG: FtsX-like permease family protein [Spirochaetota bacterium]|nr:FtsX-like permease family protein [Spirochaetota bacterium]
MLILLAFRNVLRNLHRLAPMMLSLVLIFTLMVVGNAVLNSTTLALYKVYAGNISGDLTVGARDNNNFTLFGSDQLLVGQYLVPPTLTNFPKLRSSVDILPEVRSSAGLISSAARVEIGGQKQDSIVFGVDFDSYIKLVSNLKLEAGVFPKKGEPGIVIQNRGWKNAEKLIGKKVLLAAGLGRSFTLREVPLTGIITYPVSDKMLDTVVLVDADTARALNSYLYNSAGDISISEEEQAVIESDFDSLFSFNETEEEAENETSGIDPLALFVGAPHNSDNPDTGTKNINPDNSSMDAWNFLLVSLYDKGDIARVSKYLAEAGYNENSAYLVRDWRASIGGSASLAWFLQLLFNIGLLFLSFGAAIIATNALLLSVLERTGEIGSLRAMGASRIRIFVIIFIETMLVVFGSALIGIIAGKLGTEWLNAKGLVIDNPYIKILFGGKPISGIITLQSIAYQLTAAFLLAVTAMLYPLKRALGISPVEAMAQ